MTSGMGRRLLSAILIVRHPLNLNLVQRISLARLPKELFFDEALSHAGFSV